MAERPSDNLRGLRLLIVEDEFIIAFDLAQTLEDLGMAIVGPAGTVSQALALVEAEGAHLDGAVLDVNLRDEQVFPVADALAARGIPFVFTTGYDAAILPARYADVPRCEKPVDKTVVADLLGRRGL